jgi:hypothetical protein
LSMAAFGVKHLVLASALVASRAPLQCSGDPPPDTRRYETPPDALYDLAARFKKQGDRRAQRETLKYLVERYPNSRFAVRARDELRGDGGGE